jgi:hypothetical protein
MVSFDPYTSELFDPMQHQQLEQQLPSQSTSMMTTQKSQKATGTTIRTATPTKPSKITQSEAEHAAITSYEEGWDRWDGPMWPQGTVQCELQSEQRLPMCTQHTKFGIMSSRKQPTLKQT